MSIELPKPIGAYFDADSSDGDAVAGCFTENAVVKDEDHMYEGLAAIRQWKEESSLKYTYTSVPFACEDQEGRTVVTSRVSGNIPGSPVDLRYFFILEGDRIASLEIIP